MHGVIGKVRAQLVRAGRSGRYLLGTLMTATVTLVTAPLLCVPSLATAWAERHRRRAGALLGRPVDPRPLALRRDLAWLVTQVATGLPAGLFALLCLGNLLLILGITVAWWAFPASDPPRLPLLGVRIDSWALALTISPAQFLLLAALAAIALPPLARVHARCCLTVLAPTPAEQLAARVTELTRTRTDVLQAHGAELRRIERDLHDGTQARLVAIAMRLAVAGESFSQDPDAAAALVRQAQAETEEAMTELRSVIRTIYPPVLADMGLGGALSALSTRAGVPTRIGIGELGEVPAAVEAVAYFVVTEALANIARHSRATKAAVHVTRSGTMLSAEITDDGTGGADASLGSGLDGIRRRAAALDGTMKISSPPGGPTTITVELPCV
ncbi:Signal transduction histidine kinase-like protein [Streptomyces venezuelae]|uniref:sensor histidine kinase n=1 Tax=Streptomyces gardneri TaxID=66892 RepID=UPI0006BCC045|nr:histidine kinase [Streptomyces gardneri]ALO05818.1 Signal transduction histidine kinase-like protein [Streptomyces venezuelae]WRK34580.1 histidine kinase [Streptomyces venezuelae]CUM43976.1 putative two-component system sensor kinase [Streptomyces venezuelae]